MKKADLYWLVGYLEGEGTFGYHSFSPRIGVQTTDLDVIQRVAKLIGGEVKGPLLRDRRRNPIWYVQTYGSKARDVMRLIRQYMGVRRKHQIMAVLDLLNQKEKVNGNKTS